MLAGLTLVLASTLVTMGALSVKSAPETLVPGGLASSASAKPTETQASAKPTETQASAEATETQASVVPEDAGCHIEDPGVGPYREVLLGVANARLHVPAKVPDGFTLLVHFHGGEPVRRLLVNRGLDVVFATIDAGVGSERYAATVDQDFSTRLRRAVEEKTGRTIGKLVLSSWSAGFGALRSWFKSAGNSAQAVVFLDSIHTSYAVGGVPDTAGLNVFFDLAERAVAGSPFVWLTHSSIVPPGYASTTEVADALLTHLGGQRRFAGLEPAHGTFMKTRFDSGAFHVRGTSGENQSAHCAHLRMLPELLEREVLPYLAH